MSQLIDLTLGGPSPHVLVKGVVMCTNNGLSERGDLEWELLSKRGLSSFIREGERLKTSAALFSGTFVPVYISVKHIQEYL